MVLMTWQYVVMAGMLLPAHGVVQHSLLPSPLGLSLEWLLAMGRYGNE
jgi:hypothetical protein